MPEITLSEKTITFVLGLLGGAISGLSAHYFAPWFKWKLELKRDAIARAHEAQEKAIAAAENEKEIKRKLIKTWRKMLVTIDMIARNDDITPESLLQRTSDYLSLEPYLSAEAKNAVYRRTYTIVAGSEFQGALLVLKEEISRIEAEWDLL